MTPALTRALRAMLLVAFLGACGGQTGALPTAPTGGVTPTGNGSTAVTGAMDACALLTDAEITAATGETVTTRKHSTLTQVFPSVCEFQLGGGGSVFGGNGTLDVKVLATGGKTLYEQSFEPYIGQEDSPLDEAVQGLGDKAGRSDDELMVLSGDVLFDIFYLEPGRQDKQEVERYLAEIILGKLACIAVGCPGVTPPPPLNTPRPSETAASLLGGQLTPANEKYRVVNLYADDNGPVALDIYGWDQQARASLLATVDYGQASDYFDPGIGTDDLGTTGPHLSFVRHGGELLLYGFNLADWHDDPSPGTVATIAAATGDVFGDTRELGTNFLYEQRPDGNPIASPLPDSGVLQINTDGLVYTGAAVYFYLSVGNGCLAIPDFPDVPRRVGGGLSTEGQHESADGAAAVPAGSWTLTVHPYTGVGDGFRCDNPPAAPGVPLEIANGARAFVFLYREVGGSLINTLVVPFAQGFPQ